MSKEETMNQNIDSNVEANKKKNKKSLIKFILIMCASMCGGFVIGFLTAGMDPESLGNFVSKIMPTFAIVFPIALISVNLIMYVASLVFYAKAKKKMANLDYEDEEAIENIESIIDWPVILGNFIIIINMIALGVGFEITIFDGVSDTLQGLAVISSLAALLIGFVFVVIMQSLSVGIEKSLNPEKKGNVYDMKFQKEWMDSCDEAEKMMIYKCSYESFKATNTACVILWIVALGMQIIFETGPLPGVFVCTIYFVTQLIYFYSGRKLSLTKKDN